MKHCRWLSSSWIGKRWTHLQESTCLHPWSRCYKLVYTDPIKERLNGREGEMLIGHVSWWSISIEEAKQKIWVNQELPWGNYLFLLEISDMTQFLLIRVRGWGQQWIAAVETMKPPLWKMQSRDTRQEYCQLIRRCWSGQCCPGAEVARE